MPLKYLVRSTTEHIITKLCLPYNLNKPKNYISPITLTNHVSHTCMWYNCIQQMNCNMIAVCINTYFNILLDNST